MDLSGKGMVLINVPNEIPYTLPTGPWQASITQSHSSDPIRYLHRVESIQL